MKILRSTIVLASVLFFCTPLAHAQGLDAYFGMGTARDGSTNQLVDLLGTGNPMLTTAMGGVFGTLGAGLVIKPGFGVGGEVSFRFAQGDYANTGYRPIFYDFNGIWTPSLGTKRIMPEFQGGLGGVNMRFYGGTQYYDYYTGRYSNFAGSINHLQLHAEAGLRIYIKEHIFLRPTFDYHWVRNFNEFISNSVTKYSIAIGYSTGQ
ncbi:MAG: hypothetical protein LAP85_07440 [Acidobacteriia bacterium]|nr:hypothetical protein [Terriglobia bacterium]